MQSVWLVHDWKDGASAAVPVNQPIRAKSPHNMHGDPSVFHFQRSRFKRDLPPFMDCSEAAVGSAACFCHTTNRLVRSPERTAQGQ